VGVEREFKTNEAFFSCTDRKGILLAGNRIFQAISGYAESELIGKPHNIIRHPDTPRAIFQLLWKTIQAGRPIAAFVKNMAKDGRFYWVVALVAPVNDGYISIRFKPSGSLFRTVIDLYAKMRALEAEHEQRGETGEAAMAASGQLLADALRSLGYADYNSLMHEVLLRSEIDSRDAALAASGLNLLPGLPDGHSDKPVGLEAALQSFCIGGRRELNEVQRHYQELGTFLELDKQLSKAAHAARALAEEFGLTAINISIRAMHCSDKGGAIAVVAGNLSETARQITSAVAAADQKAKKVSSTIGIAAFNIAWARLQVEMAALFYHEIYGDFLGGNLLPGSPQFQSRLRLMEWLAAAAVRTHKSTETALATMVRELSTMSEDAQAFRRLIVTLQVSKVVGLTESAHLKGLGEIQAAFDDMRARVEKIQSEFKAIEDIIEAILDHARNAPKILAAMKTAVDLLGTNARRLQEHDRPLEETPGKAKSAAVIAA